MANAGRRRGRAPLIIPPKKILDAYDAAGSLRGAAKSLGVSRWLVEQRLRQRGVSIRPRIEASDLVRYLRASNDCVRIREEAWPLADGALLVHRHSEPYDPCCWPGCGGERSTGSALCEDHRDYLTAHGCGRCMWPRCGVNVISDRALCYRHDKIGRGLMDV